ncbi:MAG: M1 family metallopeptidase [Chloroflexi bacterium]|nr:M1 family metallopeptidase [Chloroflexota bacterium]
MKRLFASLLSLSLILVSCNFPAPKPDSPTSTPEPDPMTVPWDDRSLFQDGLVASAQSVLNELRGASVYHIEFTLAGSLDQITGTEAVRYTNTEAIPLEEIHFRLFPNILGGEMTVSNLRVDGRVASPRYELANSLMIVPLSAPLEVGQSVVVRMDFAVNVPQTVNLNYGVLAYNDDVLALAHAYPVICVFNDEGWNAELPPPDGDISFADAAFYLVRIRAPKGLMVIASGREIRRVEEDQTQVLTVANGPARDFYLAASPHYEEISQTFGEVTIRSYAPKEMRDGAQLALEVASRAIEVFSRRYAPYPYTEFDIVSTPTLALGIEYPGITAIASRIYGVGGEYRGAPASQYMESTVAHEVGHQWFYHLVGNDQLDDPWLDESLTQFVTLQYYADVNGSDGEDGFRSWLESRWESVNKAEIPIGMPVADYQGGEYGAIVYGRGALFFDALRGEMGTVTFDAFMRKYTETFSWQIAMPETMQSLAEQTCACDLDALFAGWVYP